MGTVMRAELCALSYAEGQSLAQSVGVSCCKSEFHGAQGFAVGEGHGADASAHVLRPAGSPLTSLQHPHHGPLEQILRAQGPATHAQIAGESRMARRSAQ